jgi:hypothetical protein
MCIITIRISDFSGIIANYVYMHQKNATLAYSMIQLSKLLR